MKAYLLTHNPKYFDASRIEKIVEERGKCYVHWKTTCKQIEAGDHLFLMRQGKEPRGIIAVGRAVKYRLYMCQDGRWFVAVEWEQYRYNKPLISLNHLNALWPDQHWSPRGSGIQIKSKIAAELLEAIEHQKSTIQ